MLRKSIFVKNDKKKMQLTKELHERKQVPLMQINRMSIFALKPVRSLYESGLKLSLNQDMKKSASQKSNRCSQVLIQSKKKIIACPTHKKLFINCNSKQIGEDKHEIKEIHLLIKNKDLENIFSGFLNVLAQKPYQFSEQVHSYTLEKNYFLNILEYLIFILAGEPMSQVNKQFKEFSNIRQAYASIYQFCKTLKRAHLIDRQQINSSILNVVSGCEDYQKEIAAKRQAIEHQSETIDILDLKIGELTEKIEIMELYNKIQNAGLQQKRKKNQEQELRAQQLEGKTQQLEEKVRTLESRVIQLTRSIEAKQQILIERTNQTQKIFTYVAETSEMMKMVSEECKEIESDIYEYAVYLQNNAAASSLTYEQHPFIQLKKQLEYQYNILTRPVDPRDNHPQEPNVGAIKNFLMKEAQIFQSKDHEGAKAIEYKTECIRQFVDKMRKWLSNWELKQQYLAKLREEFYVLSSTMKQYFEQLQSIGLCEACSPRVEKLADEIKSCSLKIQKNYKLGNSFY